ncbi:hypothetical protein KIN20_019649 [Parelaphostrongylus tenuis]|uniref:Glycosyltransferase 2-like domain-containing protein n=1 Tax=Parelaphostrongylus tenuis TaxID=148309 RepID=A0AAD5MPT6_PARTN|nr:hypothetical protein KIN20_019649 [Parelaphostrongylus tenuis]
MRNIRRYVSRRYSTILKYVVVIGCLYVVISVYGPAVRTMDYHRRVGRSGVDGNGDGGGSVVVKPGPILQDPFVSYKRQLKNWEDLTAYKADQERVGPGEQGKPVSLPTSDPLIQQEALALYKANGYNAYISDLISLNRSMKDIRHPGCKIMEYNSQLPTVSVIFPFHEEHNSTLLRSVYSIINRSPKELLKEIILVDDFSEKPFLKKPLEDFPRT